MKALCHICVLFFGVFHHLNISDGTFPIQFFVPDLSKLADVRPTKQIILQEDVPHSTVVYLVVVNQLHRAFTMVHMIINNGHSLGRVDYLQFARFSLSVAENSLPVGFGLEGLLVGNDGLILLFGDRLDVFGSL